jgi:peptidyl-prolyl cis-trans isomerase C
MSCAVHNLTGIARPNVVSVNGVVIPRDAIAREVQNHPAPKPILAWQAAANALVVRELLLQEARRLNILPAPISDEAGRRETEEEAVIRGLVEQEVMTPGPDEESCRRYYSRNLRLFRSPAIYEAAHILFAARPDNAEAYGAARGAAEATIAELRTNPDRFDDLARARSNCPSAEHGGNLGQIAPGQTTSEFEQALGNLTPGAITAEPVATRYGFHVIRLVRRIEERQLPFALVAERIAEYLSESVKRRATAQYIARLVSQASVTGVALAGAEAHRVN